MRPSPVCNAPEVKGLHCDSSLTVGLHEWFNLEANANNAEAPLPEPFWKANWFVFHFISTEKIFVISASTNDVFAAISGLWLITGLKISVASAQISSNRFFSFVASGRQVVKYVFNLTVDSFILLRCHECCKICFPT